MLMTNLENESLLARTAEEPDVAPVLLTAAVEIHRMSISELHSAYARGSLAVDTVVQHFLSRIEERNGVSRVFVDIDHDAIARGVTLSVAKFAADEQRPLEGIPIAVSADFALSGLSHNAGMDARNDVFASGDCDVVLRLRDAGAIVLGLVNMDEAGIGCDGANPYCGTVPNPHNCSRVAGGAASGVSAAVAGGLCVLAFGLDGLGSVRVPAANCGVFAYSPTPHQISNDGIWPSVSRFDTVAAVARSMEDLSLVSNLLVNPDLATAMRRSRFMRLASNGNVDCDVDVSRVCAAAAAELREQPSDLILQNDCAVIYDAQFALRTREVLAQVIDLGAERCQRLSAQFEGRVEFVLNLSEDDFAEAEAIVDATASDLRQQIASNGVLIIPASPSQASLLDGDPRDDTHHFAAITATAGLPSVAIPAGRSSDGMPLGILLIGPMGSDAMVIAQARMLNDALRGYAPPAHD